MNLKMHIEVADNKDEVEKAVLRETILLIACFARTIFLKGQRDETTFSDQKIISTIVDFSVKYFSTNRSGYTFYLRVCFINNVSLVTVLSEKYLSCSFF